MPIINVDTVTFDQASNHPEVMKAFETYLDTEFSSENMAFKRAVDDLKAKVNDPTVSDDAFKQQAAGIYDRYMKEEGSDRMVNLKATNLRDFEPKMANLNGLSRQQIGDSFNECQKEIVGLMTNDSFSRFKATREFQTAATKVDENAALETRIGQLRQQANQARQNPSFGDRMKSTVGGQTTAQVLDGQVAELERQLNASRTLKPLDSPLAPTQGAMNHAAGKVQEQQAALVERAQKDARERALVEGMQRPPQPQVPLAPPVGGPQQPPLPQQQPEVVLVQPPQPEVAEIQQMPRGPQRPPPPRPDARQPDPPAPQVQEQEQDELDGQELDGVGMENVDDIGPVQTRARGQVVDGGDQPQTRARSVRDALGPPSPPKQGQGGPKVGGGGGVK